MGLISIFAAVCMMSTVVSASAAIHGDSLGEGTIIGYVPHPSDTVRDTSFHFGDSIMLPGDVSLIKPYPEERTEAAIPSVRTVVRIVAGDGFAHGTVEQTFRNPFSLPFEATYIFPLPHDGAVHAMDFRTGTGTYHAELKEKEQARKEYEQARQEGKQAALLLQSQDNIFVQKLCNILPEDSVSVTISFSMALVYDMGEFSVAFPTVVGPRFDPAALPKRARNPLYHAPETRTGSSLDFSVLLVSPYELADVRCASHPVSIETVEDPTLLYDLGMAAGGRDLPGKTTNGLIRLKRENTIPNKDILVRFQRANGRRNAGVMTWHDGEQGYFAMNIYPDLIDTAADELRAIDMVFVLDVSGSMGGRPIAKLKEIMNAMLDKARPADRLSFIAFSSGTSNFHETPVAATPENIAAAREWVRNLGAGGGTYMLAGVQKGLSVPLEPGRIRIMSLITDGYIGDIAGIYNAIKNDPHETIAFTFGVGSSPNRELIDAAATAGEGIARNVLLTDDVVPVVDNFWTRIRAPQIAGITIDWDGDVEDLTMTRIPGLWLGQPIRIFGRYSDGGERRITLNGFKGDSEVSETYPAVFSTDNPVMRAVPKMWARETIENLMNDQAAAGNERNREKILEISLEHDVLCTYTAFLAVADSVVNERGEMVRSDVPVPVPEGVDPVMAGGEYYAVGTADHGTPPGPQASSNTMVHHQPSLSINFENGAFRMRLNGLPREEVRGVVMIFDVTGRLVYEWKLSALARMGYAWSWNMTDLRGATVCRGAYLIAIRCPVFKREMVLFRR